MGTITSKLQDWWPWKRARPGTTYVRSKPAEGFIEIDDLDSVILGCGWFDSSHDLRTGLAVVEGEVLELQVAVGRMLQASNLVAKPPESSTPTRGPHDPRNGAANAISRLGVNSVAQAANRS